MKEKELLDYFKDLNHKFILYTPTSSYKFCGKRVIELKVENNKFILRTECENLIFSLDEIIKVEFDLK